MDANWVLFAALVFAFAVGAARLGRLHITAPIVFVGAGWLGRSVTDAALPTEATLVLAEATLALLLFHDAAQVRPAQIRGDGRLVARLLLVGLPLTIAAGYAVAVRLLGLDWGFALLLAAALAPTDAGLGAPTVLNPVVPVRVRRILNVESGVNDGLATPVVLFAVAAAAGTIDGDTSVGSAVVEALVDIGLGATVGIAVGAVAGILMTASRTRGWSTAPERSLATLVLPLAAYAGAIELGGNGFVAAFVLGTSFAGAADRWLGDEDSALLLTDLVAALLGFLVWFAAGYAAAGVVESITWAEASYAALSLTVLRMVPVWLCLLGSGLRAPTVAFVGWFGPRGLASVVFALIAVEELPSSRSLDRVAAVLGLTVLACVALHGVSADPLAERYGRWVAQARPRVETAASVEPRRGAVRARVADRPQRGRAGGGA